MKRLLLVLALLCNPALASEYWVAQTESGGQIVLTFDKTTNCGELYFMYLVLSTQEVSYGCWVVLNDMIHVRYDNGVRRVYDNQGWMRKEKM